jgi:hypothetical protein
LEKLNTLFGSGIYEPIQKDLTSKIERKEERILSKHKSGPSTEIKCHLTPYHSKLSHLYRFPKIKKKNIPVIQTVS